jgi:hypothetical protein
MPMIAAFGWLVVAAEYAKRVEGFKFSGYLQAARRNQASRTD